MKIESPRNQLLNQANIMPEKPRCIVLPLTHVLMFALKTISGMHNKRASYLGFRAPFAAWFVLFMMWPTRHEIPFTCIRKLFCSKVSISCNIIYPCSLKQYDHIYSKLITFRKFSVIGSPHFLLKHPLEIIE